MPVPAQQVDRLDQEAGDGVADEVVEAEPDPAGLDAEVAPPGLLAQVARPVGADAEQPVPVRPGTGAATPGLDAEQVVEERHHQLVVQVAVAVTDAEGDDRQPRGLQVAEQLQVRVGAPAVKGQAQEPLLTGLDQVGPDGLLEGHDQPGPDRLDDPGGAALLPAHRVVQVAVPDRVDKEDGAAAGHGRDPVADQPSADDQDAGRLGAADELVGREEDGVLVIAGPGAALGHPDRHVRAPRPSSPRPTARRNGGAGPRPGRRRSGCR